ncbi:flavin monoamine oxidase family protein [Vibrio rotiferianus]|uniref:flavin monoamine oxidase family protein n=1 Tax=Vibrio rotiferianus TaxID=190895 RepID=UPI00148C06DA|nr:FAD-dependent oxidoreductase [Vibrio rotiferianus]NOH68376.1 FAD-dependent oxidoreductase [Vibrio rotiferianus]
MSNTKAKLAILATSVLLAGNVNANEQIYDYVVVGAGAAGLSAAYKLQELNKNFIVLEKNNRAGGIAHTGIKGSFHYAKGTEYLGKPEGQLAKVIQKLKIPLVEIPSPMDIAFYQNEMHIGDKQLAHLTISESSEEEFQHFIDVLNQSRSLSRQKLSQLDKITAKQWLDSHHISPFIQLRYNVMSRGLFGASLDDISALSFIPEASFDYVDVTDVSELIEEESSQSASWTTQSGISTIATSIASTLGDKIQYRSTVQTIEKTPNGYKVHFSHKGKNNTVLANKVIVAVPAPIAQYVAQPVLTDEQKSVLSQVKYSQYITVALFSEQPVFNKAFDMAIIGKGYVTDLYDSTWVERHYNQDLKKVDEYIASAYLAPKTASDMSLLTLSDSEILDIVTSELSLVVPDINNKIEGYDITRFNAAYPVFDPYYFHRLVQLKASFRGVYLAGDYMSYPTFEAAFESGHEAVLQAESDEE